MKRLQGFGLIHIASIQLSLQTPKLPEKHFQPDAYSTTKYLARYWFLSLYISDHNKTKGLISKHLTSWQTTVELSGRFASSEERRTNSHICRRLFGCSAVALLLQDLQYLRIRWNREFCSQAESQWSKTHYQAQLGTMKDLNQTEMLKQDTHAQKPSDVTEFK